MKPNHPLNLLIVLLCLAIFSCAENASETFPEPQEITINEVKDYYNRSKSGARNRQLFLPEINWDSALFKDISIGQSILFPVEFDEIIYISGSDSTKAFKADLASYAFAYKNEDSLFLEFVQIVPTSNEALFTGYVSISDWGSGEIKRVDIYEDGLYTKTYMKGDGDNRGRSVCYEIITYYCTEREGPDDCVAVMYEYYCEEPASLAGPEPNDYTEGGGGPETGGNSMCEHPAMTGVFVRCDELVTCPSGQEPDGYGNCIVICPDGFIHKEGEGCVEDKPCFGDPVKNPEIAPQTNSGMAGGLHGTCTRDGSGCASNAAKRMHDGVDVKNAYGAPVYAMYGGTASPNTQYNTKGNVDGAGHYVSITSNVSGESIRLVYFHLQEAGRASGSVNAGDIIGYQGDSGNLAMAIQKKYTESHVHVKARSNGQKADPLDYFGTSIDSETGELDNPCNE